jgi:hypothetical protein
MILVMTATAFITFSGPTTAGASEAALFVASQAENGRRLLQSSYTLGFQRRSIFEDLCGAAEATRAAGWDGYGAEPVRSDTYLNAYRFVEALPLGRTPSVSAEPDGHIAFEWYVSPHRTLSVSVSPEGDLHYSALIGPNKAFGTEVFLGEMPTAILDLLRRVYTT